MVYNHSNVGNPFLTMYFKKTKISEKIDQMKKISRKLKLFFILRGVVHVMSLKIKKWNIAKFEKLLELFLC